MKSLRDFVYNPTESLLENVLADFGFNIVKENGNYALLKFEVITPDSFMWRLLINGAVYYLYAEDFIEGLNQVKGVLNSYIGNSKWELVKTKNIIKFEDSSPVKRASIYSEPNNVEEMMKYTVPSGPDFVFLAKSKEDASQAQFSDYAPGGFDRIRKD